MTDMPPSLWRRFVNTWRHNRRKRGYTIDMTPDGFVFTARRRETAVRWEDIVRIDAGLRDCLTFDVLYFELFTKDVSVFIEELDDGFRQFEHTLFGRWPQVRAPWEALMKAGPFQAQHHTLWQSTG